MKVLAVGNSFSMDAMRYLHQIGMAEGEEIFCCNLYIGGCSLEQHAEQIRTGAQAYEYQVNGEETQRRISVLEGLCAEKWDVVTLQQASHVSFRWDSYQPYLDEAAAFVKKHAGGAALMIHQTWAYEQGSERLNQVAGYQDAEAMFDDLSKCYARAAAELGGVAIIPCGAAMQLAVREGLTPIHRDGFHADLGYGRFMLGCVWFEALMGRPVSADTVVPLDVPVSREQLELAKKIARQACELEKS